MVHMVLCALALVLVLTGFNRVYCIHGINQAYVGLYKGVFEEAVVTVNTSGQYLSKPMFYVPKARRLLASYYQTNLSAYCRSYTYTVLGKNQGRIGYLSTYCDTIVTSFTAKISDVESKTKEAVFTIERSDFYE